MSGGLNIFSMVRDLGDSYETGYAGARKRATEDRRQTALSEAAAEANGGPVNLKSLGTKLLTIGDLTGAMTAAQLAQAQEDRQFNQGIQTRQLGLQEQSAADTKQYRDRSLDITEKSARATGIPEGFTRKPDGSLGPIAGGPKDPNYIGAVKTAEEGAKTEKKDSADKRAILEADGAVISSRGTLKALESAEFLHDKINNGAGATLRSQVIANTPAIVSGLVDNRLYDLKTPAEDTLKFNNVMKNQVLGSLKSTFGGNPTEGERKILLEVEGAEDMPYAVRADLLKRAREAATVRLNENFRKAKALRSGSYFTEDGQPSAAPSPSVAPAKAGPSAAPKVDAATRFKQLRSQGMDKAAAYKTMAEEGF